MNYFKKTIYLRPFFTKNVKKTSFSLVILVMLALFSTSCNNDEDTSEIENIEALNQKSFETQSEVEKANDGVNTIVEDFYYYEEIHDFRNPPNEQFLPDCVIITRVLTTNTKTVTIDFGDGCELRNGNFVSGKIVIVYNRDLEELTKSMQVSFINFYFNDKNIEGTKQIVRQRENDNGNPQSTYTTDITVTWLDSSFASSQGQRTREWIEGIGSGFWSDNVFLITGDWTFIKKNGTILTGIITTPLRRELSCRFLVSGIVALSKNGNVATLNYGDGECDALGTVMINDEVHEIHLRH